MEFWDDCGSCKDDYMWNPSICDCECNEKSNFLFHTIFCFYFLLLLFTQSSWVKKEHVLRIIILI